MARSTRPTGKKISRKAITKQVVGRPPASKARKHTKRKKGWQQPGPGRKRLGSKYINVSVPKELLGELDAWIAGQPDAPVYPEAIRRLVAAGLHPTAAILPPDQLAELDTWMAAQKHRPPITRLEAVRHLLGIVLRARQRPVPANDPKSPASADEATDRQLDVPTAESDPPPPPRPIKPPNSADS